MRWLLVLTAVLTACTHLAADILCPDLQLWQLVTQLHTRHCAPALHTVGVPARLERPYLLAGHLWQMGRQTRGLDS